MVAKQRRDNNGKGKQRIEERFYLFWGVIVGALLGIFGNLFTNWFYDVYKTQWWMPLVGSLSEAFTIIIIGVMTFQLYRWGWQVQKQYSKKR